MIRFFKKKRLAAKECRRLIAEIQEVVSDNSLDDPECFRRVEKIVCILEERGICCGGRHDF